MNYINPVKALMMANAINRFPPQVLFLGSEIEEHEEMGIGIRKALRDSKTQPCNVLKDWVLNYCIHKLIAE